MESGHRKIELQSAEDFTYLLDNVRRAATESINAAFPPVEGQEAREDELRVRIEELVNQYIAQTFTLAAPNLSINGLPVPTSLIPNAAAEDGGRTKRRDGDEDPHLDEDDADGAPEEAYEPFDARLRDRIPELLREEEDLLRDMAALKRRVPAAAAARLAESLRAGVAADEAALASATGRVGGPGAVERELEGKGLKGILDIGGGDGSRVGVVTLERPEQVREAFGSAVEGLGRLKRDMPATVARMERARAAGSYVLAGR